MQVRRESALRFHTEVNAVVLTAATACSTVPSLRRLSTPFTQSTHPRILLESPMPGYALRKPLWLMAATATIGATIWLLLRPAGAPAAGADGAGVAKTMRDAQDEAIPRGAPHSVLALRDSPRDAADTESPDAALTDAEMAILQRVEALRNTKPRPDPSWTWERYRSVMEEKRERERQVAERAWEKMGLPEDIRQKVRESHSRWMAGLRAFRFRALDPTPAEGLTPEKIHEAFRRDMVDVLGEARFKEFTAVKNEMWWEMVAERRRNREAARIRNGGNTPSHLGSGLDAGK